MRKINFYSNPYNIFFMFIIISGINIILPVHFISILLVGVVFIAFLECLENRYYYSLFFIILTFIFIEISHHINLGIITLISLLIYIFFKNKIRYSLSSDFIYNIVMLVIFYICLFIGFDVSIDDNNILNTMVLNYIIDIIIVSYL